MIFFKRITKAVKKAFEEEKTISFDEWERLSRDFDFIAERAANDSVFILRNKVNKTTTIYVREGFVFRQVSETPTT